MKTPTLSEKVAKATKAFREWDRTYAYDGIGFTPKLF
jgi:hypothetical protein